MQDLLTKPVTRQRLDRLGPPLGLVMKTSGDDDENSATWAGHLSHIGYLRPVRTCRFGERFPLTIIAHSLTSAHETVPFSRRAFSFDDTCLFPQPYKVVFCVRTT